jgi:hypothetical protein
MQARFATTLFASTALIALSLSATAALGQTDVLVIEGTSVGRTCAGQAGPGVYRSVDSGRTSVTPAAPSSVTTAPQAARLDAFIAVDGVNGESTSDKQRNPPAQQAPAANCPRVNSSQPQESDALSYNFSGIEGAAAQTAPANVQTSPQGNMPIFLELDGVPGEGSEAPSSPPPPPPPPPPPRPPSSGGGSLPMEEIAFNYTKIETPVEGEAQDVAAPQAEQAALLVPAVQRVRESAARTGGPQMDGVVLLNQEEGQAGKGAGTGTLTLSNGSASAQAEAQQQEEESEQRERPRRNFSLTIGGVTVGTGGVSVAAGDIDGDGRESSSRSRRPSTRPARADDAGNGRR